MEVPVKSVATLLLISVIMVLGFYGCGDRGSTAPSAPAIRSLNQSCAPVGAEGLTLLVGGLNFSPSSVVRWNGSDRPTVASSASGLHADIPASDLAAPGTASITVFTPGGGSSNSVPILITPGGVNPQSVTVDPSGKFAYVANYGCSFQYPGNISMYTTNSTGTLASIGGPVTAGFGPHAVVVDPSSRFAYVVNDDFVDLGPGLSTVSTHAIDAATGGHDL
jgi:hypothetical protein